MANETSFTHSCDSPDMVLDPSSLCVEKTTEKHLTRRNAKTTCFMGCGFISLFILSGHGSKVVGHELGIT